MTEAQAILAAGVLAAVASLLSILVSLHATRKQSQIAKELEESRKAFEKELLHEKVSLETEAVKRLKEFEANLVS